MKQGLLVFLVICGMCAAMVRRIPRAIEVDETKTEPPTKICAYSTPCAWSIYKVGYPELIEQNVTNTYCKCGSDTECLYYENESATNSIVYRCQKEKS